MDQVIDTGTEQMVVSAWAARWFEGKVQIVWFVKDQGIIRMNTEKAFLKKLVRDLNETMVNGDDQHEFHYEDFAKPFILPRSVALDMRHHMVKMLELGPGRTPFAGYGSAELELNRESGVQIVTPQVGRWI